MNTLKAVELFAGGGGVGIGLKDAGVDVVLAVERDPVIADVYRANLGDRVVCSSVGSIDYRPYKGVDIVTLTPPCQNDSRARPKALPEHPDRLAGLEAIEALCQILPRYVILENVPEYAKNPVYDELLQFLWNRDYWVNSQVVNFADWGVPQNRNRLIMIASRANSIPCFPLKERHQGWFGAIKDLLPYCKDSVLADWQQKRIGDRLSETILIARDGANIHSVNPVSWDKPCQTIRAFDGRHAHPFDAIYQGNVKWVDVACLKRLQTFPDWYQFPSDGKAVKIIGNSVPPLVIKKIAGLLC